MKTNCLYFNYILLNRLVNSIEEKFTKINTFGAIVYAENLKKIRKELNLSVDKLAEKIGIPASTLWGYEGKKRVPSIELSIQLYRVLNVNLNWFVSGIGDMFNTNASDDEFTRKVDEVLKKRGLIK